MYRYFAVFLWVAFSSGVEAQKAHVPVIGYLSSGVQKLSTERLRMFREGLSQAGYTEDQNIAIEYRWAEGRYDRLPALATDLVNHNVQGIVIPDSVVPAAAAKEVTKKIPIVFGIGADPVKAGLVDSIRHPGGNLTGAARMNVELEPKRLEILHELIPKAKTFALLVNPRNPNARSSENDMASAARLSGVVLHVLRASNDNDLDSAFAALMAIRADGLVIAPDPFFISRSKQIGELTFIHRIPAIFQYREFVAAGGLISYAGSPTEGYRLMGLYIARILKGERPADLPVQQYVKIEMIINLETAKVLKKIFQAPFWCGLMK